MSNLSIIIGNKLRSLRKEKGLTQEDMAKALNLSQSAYARMENGKSNSWASHLESICNFFDIDPEELFQQNRVIINNVKSGVGYAQVERNFFGYVETVNQLSEKLIEQFEVQLREKDKIIDELKKQVKK